MKVKKAIKSKNFWSDEQSVTFLKSLTKVWMTRANSEHNKVIFYNLSQRIPINKPSSTFSFKVKKKQITLNVQSSLCFCIISFAELSGFVWFPDNCARCPCHLPCAWHMVSHVTQAACWWGQRNQDAIKRDCFHTNRRWMAPLISVSPLANNTTL